MPDFLARQFTTLNNQLDNVKSRATKLAADFATASPRIEVVEAHRTMRAVTATVAAARQRTGMNAYAVAQWGDSGLDFIAKALEIEAAADAVADFVEQNFPTLGTALDSAMTAASVPAPQQATLRTELGGNLDYLLINQISGNLVISTTISAAALAPLVALLTTLATAATF